jgi:hypothetical protein
MAVDFSSISGYLKRVYSPEKIEDQQNRQYITWSMIQKAPEKPSGLGFFGSVLLAGNQEGLGSQNELENLRQSGAQRTQQFQINNKILTDTIQFSGLSLDLAKTNVESFANTLTFQIEESMTDAFKELNGQLFRDGSGVVARLAAIAAPGATVLTFNNVQYIKQFEKLDIFDAATNTVLELDGGQVIDINIVTNQVTLAAPIPVGLAVNDFVYRTKVHTAAPVDGKELGGLRLAVDDGTVSATYEGIPRTGAGAFPNWRGIIVNAGAVNLSNDLLQRTIMRMKVAGSAEPDMLVAHPQQTRKYLDIVTPLKRFDKTGNLDSGYTKLEWNGRPWMEDTDCPADAIYMINKKYFRKYEMRGLSLDDQSGQTLKWNPGFDGFIAYLKYYGNLGSQRPSNLARLENLVVPTF